MLKDQLDADGNQDEGPEMQNLGDAEDVQYVKLQQDADNQQPYGTARTGNGFSAELPCALVTWRSRG